MFIRAEVFEKVGIFDERFFLYLEDVDYSRRIHSQFKTIYFPEVSIIHSHKKGSFKSPKLMIIHIISAIKYFSKWGWFFDHERANFNNRISLE